jgi:metallo-beta-lactamase family protein
MAKAFMTGELPRFPIYIDSPMAIAANQLYSNHFELMDEEAARLLKDKRFTSELKRFTPCESAEESKELNTKPGPFMVLAGAGMCNAGRILHHLKQNLWRKETLVMIVGYQGTGTLGRKLVDGATEVTIFGEKIQVSAQVVTLGGYSAHAGQSDLIRWIGPAAKNKCRVILMHGESKGRKPLARKIKEVYGINAEMPEMFDTVEV